MDEEEGGIDDFDEEDDLFLSQLNVDLDYPTCANLASNQPDITIGTPEERNQDMGNASFGICVKSVVMSGTVSHEQEITPRKRFHELPLDDENFDLPSRKITVLQNSVNLNETTSPRTPRITPKKSSKRRFPGPAGLLPTLKSVDFKLLEKSRFVTQQINKLITEEKGTLKSPSSSQSNSTTGETSSQECLSQNDQPLLEKHTWRVIKNHLNLTSGTPGSTVLNQLNISWIRRNISWLPSPIKIPFLLIILQDSPELNGSGRQSNKTPCVRCVDHTGTIEAAIDFKFASTYIDDLNPGTCLALQNVGLLRLRKKEVMITITDRNLICMISASNEEDINQLIGCDFEADKLKVHRSTKEGNGVKITEFSEFCPEDIMISYEQVMSLNVNLDLEMESDESSEKPPALWLSTSVNNNNNSNFVNSSEYFPSNINSSNNYNFQASDNNDVDVDDDSFREMIDAIVEESDEMFS